MAAQLFERRREQEITSFMSQGGAESNRFETFFQRTGLKEKPNKFLLIFRRNFLSFQIKILTP